MAGTPRAAQVAICCAVRVRSVPASRYATLIPMFLIDVSTADETAPVPPTMMTFWIPRLASEDAAAALERRRRSQDERHLLADNLGRRRARQQSRRQWRRIAVFERVFGPTDEAKMSTVLFVA